MRVAFHAINGVGLGHLVRALTLADEVRRLEPSAALLILTSAVDTSRVEAAGFDFVQFPPRLAEPHADPHRARSGLPEDLSNAALLGAFEAFRPDLVVFDTHAPAAVVRGAAALGARTVLVLRELRPKAFREFLSGKAADDFDRIVVPHGPGEVSLSGVPDDVAVEVVGPVVREGASRADAGDPPRLLVLAGGGGQPVDGARYLRAAADAHILARTAIPSLETVLLPGPYAPPFDARRIPGLTVLRDVLDVAPLLASAHLVVSQAGYNAIAEIRAAAVPALLVPGARRAEDQSARARRLVRIGAAAVTKPEARALADRIEALFLDPGALGAMRTAHGRCPLVPRTREAAEAVLRPVRLRDGLVRRVVLVAHDFPPRLGGMETVAFEVSRGLALRGLDVTVYTTRRLGLAAPRGVRVRALYTPLGDGRTIDLAGDLLLTVNALAKDAPDAVHLAHAGLAPWVPLLAATLPARVTVSVHGNDLLAPWVRTERDEISTDAYRHLQAEGLKAAAAVLPVSTFSAGLALAAGAVSERVVRVPNGVDGKRYRPGPKDAPLARRLGIGDDDDVLLTVARLAPRKGHATVIRALPELLRHRPSVRYVFTGGGDRALAELMALARSLGVGHRVTAVGRVRARELPALFRLARVFVLVPDEVSDADGRPSDVEGFGVALLEAAATGLPAVAARSGGVPEAVVDGSTGLLVPPGDAAAVASAVRTLLESPGLAGRLGRAARRRALAEHSGAATCDGFVAAWRLPARAVPEGRFASAARLLGDVATPAAPRAAALARLARRAARDARAVDAERREALERAVRQGRTVKLRATGDGARLLPAALDACASLGHRPDLEVKLRLFLDDDFRRAALPRAGRVHLHHSLPAVAPGALLSRVESLSDAEWTAVASLRLHLATEVAEGSAEALASVPEAHRLRDAFLRRGVTVVPPPSLTRYLATTPAGTPATAMVEPTNRCNLACPTCPTGTGKISPLPDLTPEAFGVALDGLPGLRNLALWNYGEPTMNRHLPGLIAEAKRRGVGVVKVSSNVHFLNGDRGLPLLESGLDVLILSVDGASEETYRRFRQHGSFARVSESVRALCREKKARGLTKPRIELQFIAMRHNEHELDEIRRLAAEWGVDRLRIKTVGADDPGNRDLVPRDLTLSRYGGDGETPNRSHPFCTMAWDHTVINVDGSVTPCCYLRPDMGERFVMGNAFERPFVEIWRGERYQAFRASMLLDRGAMPVCDRCRGGTHDLLAAVEEVEDVKEVAAP